MRPYLLLSFSFLILNILACYDVEDVPLFRGSGQLVLLEHEQGYSLEDPIAAGERILIEMRSREGSGMLNIIEVESSDPDVLGVHISDKRLGVEARRAGVATIKVKGTFDYFGGDYYSTITLRVEQTRALQLEPQCMAGADGAAYLSGQDVVFRAKRVGDSGPLSGGPLKIQAEGVVEELIWVPAPGYIAVKIHDLPPGALKLTSPEVSSWSHELRIVSPTQIDELLLVDARGEELDPAGATPRALFVQPAAGGTRLCQPNPLLVKLKSNTLDVCSMIKKEIDMTFGYKPPVAIEILTTHEVPGQCSLEFSVLLALEGLGLTRTIVFDAP